MRRLIIFLAATAASGTAMADDYIRLNDDTSKCIHKKRDNFDNGNPIHLWDCDDGSEDNKSFVYDDATGYIHFLGDTSKCIHKKNADTNNGNPIHLWSCSAGGDNNKSWTYDEATGYIHLRTNTSKCIHKKNADTNNGNPLHLWNCGAGGDNNKSWSIDVAADGTVELETHSGAGSTAIATGLSTDGVAFAQVRSYTDTTPVYARLEADAAGALSVSAQRPDGQTAAAEDISVVSFVGDPTDLGFVGETGTLSVDVDSRDERFEISFSDTYSQPVLFLQVVADGDPLSAQPVFVESTGALISVTEGSGYDGARASSVEIHWAVFEAGDYLLSDGRLAVIGAVDSGTSTYDMANGTAIPTYFQHGAGSVEYIESAAVLAQAQRAHGDAWQSVRVEPTEGVRLVLNGEYDWDTGSWGYDEYRDLEALTVRHSREADIEGAEDPEATVGPIGYLIIGDASGTYSVFDAVNRYDVADDASNFAVNVPDAVYRAMGGDPDGANTSTTYTSTRDGLSIVRMTAVALLSADNGQYVDEYYGQLNADAAFDRAIPFVRILLSDGTSALYDGTSGSRMVINDGVLERDLGDIDRAARFGIKERADGTVSIHTHYGYYVSVAADGSLSADATDVGTSETFYMVNLSQIAMSAYPDMRLVEQDMDGDDDPEMVLVAEKEDGTGYLMLDPLGIADLMYKAGYEPDDAFIDALSATQQAGLLQQLDGITGIDSIDDIDGATLKSILDSMDGDAQDRDYSAYSFEYVLEGAGYELSGETDDGLFGGTIALGEYTVMVEGELFDSLNLDLGLTLITVSGSIGALTVSASAVGANATMKVNDNGFLIGAGVELIGVTVMIGDEDGSYASVSAGVGLGAALGASWGQNDQYGVTVDLPIVPVAVAVYVKGEDVENLALAIADLSIQGYNAVAPHASAVWDAATSELSNAGESALASVTDEYNDTKATVNKFGNRGITMAESAGEIVINEINDFINDAGSVLSDLGNGLEDGFNDLIGGLGDFFSFSWL